MAGENQNHYWASSPFPHPVEYPKWAYHTTKDAKQVNSPDELAALGSEWSTNYADKKRDYPKMKFKAKTGEIKPGELHYETAVADDPEAEGKLGSGWGDTVPPAPGAPPPAAAAKKNDK